MEETLILESPTSVINNPDAGVKQALSFAKKVLKEIYRAHTWEVLLKEQSFTTDGSGSYPFSTIVTDGDYGRVKESTEWDFSNNRKIYIVSAVEWQALVNSTIGTLGISRYGRARGGNLLMTPDASGDTVVFEYISNFLVEDSGGTRKLTFTADTDVPVFDEDLVELGLKAYFKNEHGLDASEDFDLYYSTMQEYIDQEKPSKIIRGRNFKSKYTVNIPDTGIGQ